MKKNESFKIDIILFSPSVSLNGEKMQMAQNNNRLTTLVVDYLGL